MTDEGGAKTVAAVPIGKRPAFEDWFSQFDPHHGQIDRVKFLTDGVFAIAMTLLAIEIHPPEHWNGQLDGLGHEFLVGCLAYLVGFAVLSGVWVQQRRMLALLERIDSVATGLTLATLAAVCLLPASVGLQVRYSQMSNSFLIYGGLFLVLSTILLLFWGYIALVKRLIRDDVPERNRRGTLALLAGSNRSLLLAVIGFAQLPPSGDLAGPSAIWIGAAFALMLASVPIRRWARKVPEEPAPEAATAPAA